MNLAKGTLDAPKHPAVAKLQAQVPHASLQLPAITKRFGKWMEHKRIYSSESENEYSSQGEAVESRSKQRTLDVLEKRQAPTS